MSQIQVRDNEGFGASLVNVRLGIDGQSVDDCYDDRFTDYAGNTAWPNPLPSSSGYILYVNYRNVLDEYGTALAKVDSITNPGVMISDDAILVPTEDDPTKNDIRFILPEKVKPIQAIHIDGDVFRTEDNNIWRMCFGSNFMLPQMVAEGINIVPLLYSGLNGFRMFGSYWYIAEQVGMKHWHPSEYPNYFNAISDTFDILTTHNKYACLNMICDNQLFNKDVAYLQDWQNKVVDILKSKRNALYSLGNENEANGFNADNFTRPVGVISACGSGLTGGPAPLSRHQPWDMQYQHLRRDTKMFIDIPPVDAPTYWLEHKLLFDETIGFADFNDPGRRTNNSDWAYKMGRIMSAFNGGVIHLHSGGHSQPLGEIEEFCKDEFVRAFNG